MELLKKYTSELNRLNYSPRTQETYPSAFAQFLYYYKGKDYRYIKYDDIIAYLTYLVQVKKVGASTQNTAINAIKFYYEKILHQPRKTYYITRPRKQQTVIELLEDDEIQKLFDVCKNIKHTCIIGLLYCGLRISELIDLKIEDINSKRMLIIVQHGKGNKYREVPLPQMLLIRLREYYKKENPKVYLFNGESKTSLKYSDSSVRQFLKKYAKDAGIEKDVFPHLLRHNFTTEHIENETNILKLQKMLGHNSPKTTMGYYRLRRDTLRNTNSPLDKVKF